MQLQINGETRDVRAASVRELMLELGFGDQPVAVELNRQVVPRRRHDDTALHDGDCLEVVTLVGGG